MIFQITHKYTTRFYSAVCSLDRIFSPRARHIVSWSAGFFVFVFLCLSVLIVWGQLALPPWASLSLSYLLAFVDHIPGIDITNASFLYRLPISEHFSVAFPFVSGLGFWNIIFGLSIATYLYTALLTIFARSAYFQDLASAELFHERVLSYVVSEIFQQAEEGDVLRSFVQHPIGKHFFQRIEVTQSELGQFLVTRMHIVDYREVPSVYRVHTISELILSLCQSEEVALWLQRKGIHSEDIAIAASWVESEYRIQKEQERWWGREALARIPVFGEEIAYGYGLLIKKFTTPVLPVESHLRFTGVSAEDPVAQLLELLQRSDGTNALIISPSIAQGMDIMQSAVAEISRSQHPRFTHKKCLLFDIPYFEQHATTVSEFESILTSILLDALRSGNCILIIDNITALIQRGLLLGADVDGILRPILESAALQVIALTSIEQFHGPLSAHQNITHAFHELHIEQLSDIEHLRRLIVYVEHLEREQSVLFSVRAVHQIITDANRVRTNRTLFDQSRDILAGIVSTTEKSAPLLITKDDVDEYVAQHTHIPIGPTGKDEEIQLLNLEKVLHQSVVGQDKAIHAISQSLRRSRLGLRNENRPIASFLFFGPTGVGKTEVAKTIAREYFHSEENMHRFDMTEFSDHTALERFIGGVDSGDGALVTCLLERPYAVLLLDEFEKANRNIHDLFLQIIDEGYFHDVSSRKINCTNLVIIATSNIAAEEIYAHIRNGTVLTDVHERQLIAHTIEQGLLRSELLNRFDELILFQPLSSDALRRIAELMLSKFAKRLLEKGVVLQINDVLLQYLMSHGVDPLFGARPMQRVIQNSIEPIIAEKLLRHELSSGMSFAFTEADLPK